MSTLLRYHFIDLDDLRRAGQRASQYRGAKEVVVTLTPPAPRTDTELVQSAS